MFIVYFQRSDPISESPYHSLRFLALLSFVATLGVVQKSVNLLPSPASYAVYHPL